MGNITAANAVFTLTIPNVLLAPVQLQGFSADDVFDTTPLEAAETQMGVDGILSAGFVFVAVEQGITLQADSASVSVFDTWRAQEYANKTKYPASGQIKLPAISTKWSMVQGFLRTYPIIPNAGRVLRPRKFIIMWQNAFPQPG
jgi:predicted ABC-type sugar transport system permease subunit